MSAQAAELDRRLRHVGSMLAISGASAWAPLDPDERTELFARVRAFATSGQHIFFQTDHAKLIFSLAAALGCPVEILGARAPTEDLE